MRNLRPLFGLRRAAYDLSDTAALRLLDRTTVSLCYQARNEPEMGHFRLSHKVIEDFPGYLPAEQSFCPIVLLASH